MLFWLDIGAPDFWKLPLGWRSGHHRCGWKACYAACTLPQTFMPSFPCPGDPNTLDPKVGIVYMLGSRWMGPSNHIPTPFQDALEQDHHVHKDSTALLRSSVRMAEWIRLSCLGTDCTCGSNDLAVARITYGLVGHTL